jgi:hypothetical protein
MNNRPKQAHRFAAKHFTSEGITEQGEEILSRLGTMGLFFDEEETVFVSDGGGLTAMPFVTFSDGSVLTGDGVAFWMNKSLNYPGYRIRDTDPLDRDEYDPCSRWED